MKKNSEILIKEISEHEKKMIEIINNIKKENDKLKQELLEKELVLNKLNMKLEDNYR